VAFGVWMRTPAINRTDSTTSVMTSALLIRVTRYLYRASMAVQFRVLNHAAT
jgi:hypothetical protein